MLYRLFEKGKSRPPTQDDGASGSLLNMLPSQADEHSTAGSGHETSLLETLSQAEAYEHEQAAERRAQEEVLYRARLESSYRDQEAKRMAALQQMEADRAAVQSAALSASPAQPAGDADVAPGENNTSVVRVEQKRQLDMLAQKLSSIGSLRKRPAKPQPAQSVQAAAPASVPPSPPASSATIPVMPSQPVQAASPAPVPAAGLSADTGEPFWFSDYFSPAVLVRRLLAAWLFIMACALLGAVLAAAFALGLPNRYKAMAEVLVEPRQAVVIDNPVAPQGLNREATIAFLESQVRIVQSNSVIDRVVDELQLYRDQEFVGESFIARLMEPLTSLVSGDDSDPDPRTAARDYLMENSYALRLNQTFTIQIGVITQDREKSARVANAIARIYLNAEADARSAVAGKATAELGSRLTELREKVRISEEKVERYKAENGLVDAEGRLIAESKLTRLSEELTLAQIQTADAKTRAQLAAGADLADVISGSLPAALASPAIGQLRVVYSQARSRLDRLSTSLGARHPNRIAAQAELNSAREAIAQEIRRVVSTAQEEQKRVTARRDELQAQVNTLKASNVTDNAAKVKLRELNREVEANRRVLEAFLLRSRETGEQENIRTTSARVISEAVPPNSKDSPNRKLIVAAGGILGGGLGAALALLPLMFVGARALVSSLRRPAPKRRGSSPPSYAVQQQMTGEGDLYGAPIQWAPQPAAAPPSPVQAAVSQPQWQPTSVAAPVAVSAQPIVSSPQLPPEPVAPARPAKPERPEQPESPMAAKTVAPAPAAPEPARLEITVNQQPVHQPAPAPQPAVPQQQYVAQQPAQPAAMPQPQPAPFMQQPPMGYAPAGSHVPVYQPQFQPVPQPVFMPQQPAMPAQMMVPQPMMMMPQPVPQPSPVPSSVHMVYGSGVDGTTGKS